MSSILAARLSPRFCGARNTEQLLIFIKKNYEKINLMHFLDENSTSLSIVESYSKPFGIEIITKLSFGVYFHHTELSYLTYDYAIIVVNEDDAYYIMLKPYSNFTQEEKNTMREQAYRLLQRWGRVIENQDIPF